MTTPATPTDGHVEIDLRPAGAGRFAAIITLHGEHDMATSLDLAHALDTVAGHVLVDLTPCTFIDSSVIGVLFEAVRDLERDGYQVELVVPPLNAPVVRTLEIVGLGQRLVVHPRCPHDDLGQQRQ
ncbi:MAG: STAS domain-containing protein [Gaiellales bacterium]